MPSIYQEFKFDSFQGGYYGVFDVDPEMLPPQFLSSGQRIQYNKAFISKSDGKQFYMPQPVVSTTGGMNGIYVFQQSNGNTFLVLSTTSRLYALAGGSSSWTDITPTVTLTGTLSFAPKFTAFNDSLYYTDGVDPIVQWTGTGRATYVTSTGSPLTCSDLVPFAGYLFALRPTVSGTGLQNWTVMWSDNVSGQGTNSWNSGQAGTVSLIDSQEQIYGGEVFGLWMPIYKKRTIYLTQFIGPPVFFDFQRVDTPGTIARRTIQRVPQLGLFAMGEDDCYIFNATQSRPIGKQIRQELFTNLNYNALDTAFAWVRPDLGRIYLNVAFGTSTVPDHQYAYSYVDGQWMPEGHYTTVAGTWASFSNNLLVNQLVLPSQAYTMTVAQLVGLNQSQPIITDGTSLLYLAPGVGADIVTPTQVPINSNWSTAKIPLVQRQDKSVQPATVFFIKLQGNNVAGNISVTLNSSIGDGIYSSFGPFNVSLTTAQQTFIPCEVYGERFQLTIANNNVNEGFQIKQVSLMFRPRGRV